MKVCKVVYDGPTFPEFHGTKCYLPEGHDSGPPGFAAKHRAIPVNGRHEMEWYTPAQKAAYDAEKAMPRGEET